MKKERNKIQHRKSFITPSLHLCTFLKQASIALRSGSPGDDVHIFLKNKPHFLVIQRCRDGVMNDFLCWILFLSFFMM